MQIHDEEANLILGRIKAYKGSLHDVGIIAQNQFILGSVRVSLEKNQIPYVFIPDFSAKSIEKKYEGIFSEISLFPTDKNFNGKISTRIRQVYAKYGLREDTDDVLRALAILASNFDTQARSLPFSERALQFYNDIFVQLNWGNLLRKTVKNKVFLSTIHGVKGLQFAEVHILGLSCFEHIYSQVCISCNWGKNVDTVFASLDDTQKTLYVGSTRAQDQLYLYSTQKNNQGKIRKIVCLLAPYKDLLEIQGSSQFCGN